MEQQQQQQQPQLQLQAPQPIVVLPTELPPSRIVYVLTTSEGRDKLFKLCSFALLTLVKVLQDDTLLPYPPEDRKLWVARFTANLSTIRFGRCLFRLGRWMITFVYLHMSIRFLALLLRARVKKYPASSLAYAAGSSSGGGKDGSDDVAVAAAAASESDDGTTAAGRAALKGVPSRLQILLAALLVVRNAASLSRSFIRDALFLSDTGFAQCMRLGAGTHAVLERVQQALWVTTSLADMVLVEYRLSLPGWVPDLRSLRCACDPARAALPTAAGGGGGDARFQFTPLDLDFGAPHPLVPSFFTALAPADMPIVCRVCDRIAAPLVYIGQSNSSMLPQSATGNNNTGGASSVARLGGSNVSSSDVLFLPNLVRRMFEYVTVLAAHGNLREMLMLRIKCFCELTLSLALATHTFSHFSSFDVRAGNFPHVAWTTTVCGMTSAFVSLHRVWLAAK